MTKKIVQLSALFMLMLITGVFWGTWFTLTRSLEEFPASEFIHIGKVIIANVAMPMRVIMPLGIVLVLLTLWMQKPKNSPGFYAGLASIILIIAVLLITLLVLVPIDNSIKTWTEATVPANWESMRMTWKSFHAIRTFASLASFLCFSLFMISSRNS